MNNEKSMYEILQEQINRQDKTINKLIKTNIIITLILAVVMIVFTLSYFWAPYKDYGESTTISGDNNNSLSKNELNSSEINSEN